MWTRGVLALICLPLVFASSANAWTAPPVTDEGRLAAYLPIARAAWPNSPCSGRETVYLHADNALNTADAGDGIDSAGRSNAASCEVWMRSSYPDPNPSIAATFCAELVHEFGHLAGYGHTDDPNALHAQLGPWATVMESHANPVWPVCDAVTYAPPSAQARATLRSILPVPRASWKIICTPLRNTGRCRAVRRGSITRRFNVTVSNGDAQVRSATLN